MPPQPNTPDVTLCTSTSAKTAGQNCGMSFPNKTYEGLCAGCLTLCELIGADFETVRAYPRCVDCGAMYRAMTYERDGAPLCATCASGSPAAALSIETQNQQATRTARMNLISQSQPNRPSATTIQKLKNRAVAGSSSNKAVEPVLSPVVQIAVEIFIGSGVGKAKILDCGHIIHGFEIDNCMRDDVLAHFLKILSVTWDSRHEHSITDNDVVLRFHGNGTLSTEIDGMSLRDFISAHSKSLPAQSLPANMNQYKKKVGAWPNFMYFELHIQSYMFTKRTNKDVNLGKKTTAAGKRKLNAPTTVVNKRLRLEGQEFEPVVSQFVPRVSVAAARRTLVDLYYVMVKVSKETQQPYVAHKERRTFESPSYIHDVPFAKGLMKAVYRVDLPGSKYVAKRFHQADADGGRVTLDGNCDLISKEVLLYEEIRPGLLDFYQRARTPRTHSEVTESLEVSQALIGYEFPPDNGTPSPASDILEDEQEEACEGGITWLLEPFYSGRETKFVGTLNHQTGELGSKLAATVHAFIHFFYEYTKETMVLVDVQTISTRVDGKFKHVIFDPMAHTGAGDSGPGDHGQDGIDNFLQTHQCNSKCRELKLKPLLPEESEDDGSEA
ncbi:kinase-like domain-containing protein [Mycena amicta]|nr:kinase-like domain-containing protein [Mycena amicta]